RELQSILRDLPPAKLYLDDVVRIVEIFIDAADLSNVVDGTQQLYRYLPFAVSVRAGDSLNHIVNESVYPVLTDRRTVEAG
ncbi:MAG: hypothetical protein WA718_13720, partial [Terriglobales bacterium]